MQFISLTLHRVMGLGVLRAQIWTDNERFIRQFVFILSVYINIVLKAGSHLYSLPLTSLF